VPRLPKKDDPPLTPASKSTLKGRRIIFVLFNLELGGAERQALILAHHLVQHEKAKVEVWGFNKTGPVAQICDQLGLPWRIVPFPLKSGSFARKKLPQERKGAKKNQQNQQEDFGDSISPPSGFRGRFFAPLRLGGRLLAPSLVGLVRLALSLRRARPDVLLPYTFVPNVVCGLIWKWTGARACVWNQRDEGVMRFVTEWAPSAAGRAGEPSGSSVGLCRSANLARLVTTRAQPKTVTSVKGDTMARKSRIVSSTSSTKPPRRKRARIEEPFQIVSSATVARGAAGRDIKVPMLVLYGEWLAAIGFPIGAAAYLVSDQRGELALCRVGLRLPRRLKIRATPA